MQCLYNAVLFLYHLAIRMAALFHPKARLFIEGRREWHSRLKGKRDPQATYIWFHCASLGEFEQGRPVIEAIRQQFPRYKIALTFFSPSGYEVRKNYPGADYVGYLPVDTPGNARRFIDTLDPAMVFFIKYEFWVNYISFLKARAIPLYLVSGIFRKEQLFFSRMPWGKWFRGILKNFTHIFVQDEDSAALLSSIGTGNFTVSGDTRFDRVAAIAKSSQPVPIVEKFSAGKPVLIAGSTWNRDEELLVPFIEGQENWKFIIVPHEVTPGNINRLTRLLKKEPLLFSQATPENITLHDVLVVDTVGLLSSLYRYGTIAYIGGGFGVGIHNILEAATFGLPVFFGPNYHKFREACQLVEAGAAIPVTTSESFTEQALRVTGDNQLYEQLCHIAADYVKNNQGATSSILKKVTL